MGRLGPPPCEGRRGEGEPRGSPRSSPGRRCLCPGAARRARGRGWQRPRSFVSGKGSRRRAQIKQNRKKKKHQTCPPCGGGGVGGTVAVPEELSGRVGGCWGCAGCRTAARMSLKGLLQRCLSSKDSALEVILLLFLLAVWCGGTPSAR